MTFTEFARRHVLEFGHTRHTAGRDREAGWPKGTRHYMVRLRFPGGGRFACLFSMGPALEREPQVEDVLDSLQIDCRVVQDCANAREYASEFGHDWDDPKVRREDRATYAACVSTEAKLRAAMGTDSFEAFMESTHE